MISMLVMSRMIGIRAISWVYKLVSELGDAWDVMDGNMISEPGFKA